jgi:Protein of unknown function (DUF3892)
MAVYRIVCTTQAPADKMPSHQHIVGVGTGTDPNHANKLWTLQQVLNTMDAGEKFFSQGVVSGKQAYMEDYTCRYCNRRFIRSRADAVQDNNLDNLRRGCAKS